MSDPYIGQIIIAGFSYAPYSYAECNGNLLPIVQYSALYSLIGNTFGGNGSNFALPDLRSRVPVHPGPNFLQGKALGQESVSLTAAEIPAHTHNLHVSTATADAESPADGVLAAPGIDIYASGTPDATLNPATIGVTGSGHPHNNIQPSLALNFCIALNGNMPLRP